MVAPLKSAFRPKAVRMRLVRSVELQQLRCHCSTTPSTTVNQIVMFLSPRKILAFMPSLGAGQEFCTTSEQRIFTNRILDTHIQAMSGRGKGWDR